MSLFKKFFGNATDPSEEGEVGQYAATTGNTVSLDERFIVHFRKNGGKFIYCESTNELREQFLNILEENDWFECETLCFDPSLFYLLNENKLQFKEVNNPVFFLSPCENLLADDGSVLFSSNQIKNINPKDLPANMIVVATTHQILESKSDGLREIKKKYNKDYPSNITTIKYFEKAKEEDFLQYGSCAKNLYLLLLEE
ncbi:MAG: lactate utilization protein B/C [Flavobacterium sp. BFFFF2]|nr:MAG: lactate utilization protein B/C [Flavobacterium sp. BFFFF2]